MTRGSLGEYRRKRDFDQTPEPRGAAARGRRDRLRFVIQKHAASHLHYDFRLELGGVLKSWAVPKGPSLDPADRRLAMHVEDHPLEYGSFEGVIPEGQYGGGTVLVWDRGTWEPRGDPEDGYRRGRLRFRLRGDKLAGEWLLVRMKREAGGKESWLLRKRSDAAARPGDGAAIVEERPESVDSGRDLEDVRLAAERVWESDRPALRALRRPRAAARTARAARGGPARRSSSRGPSGRAVDPGALPGARRRGLPGAGFRPALATLVRTPPDGDRWLHEIKIDGYRILCRIEDGEARLVSRNGRDWTDRYPPVVAAAERLPVRTALLDGEVAVYLDDGTTSFQALQNAAPGRSRGELRYVAFDLLHLDGWDVSGAPLEARKRLLEELLAGRDGSDPVRFGDHVAGRGRDVLRSACEMALEGIVSKRRDAPYRPGRGRDWLKTKCTRRQEAVVVGWTDPEGSRVGFGSLVLAVHDDAGKLRYAGRVGTGFDDRALRDIAARLAGLARDGSPLDVAPRGRGLARVHWVEPQLVAEVELSEWTAAGHLRHPSFQGLREDKAPDEVKREAPLDARPGHGAATGRTRARSVPARSTPAYRLTHPDRVLYPDQGLTKRDLARWMESVAGWLLPHVAGRPVSLVRCPEGRAAKCFYQKHAGTSTPRELRRVTLAEKSGTGEYLVIDDLAGLLATVQMGVLEIHTWGSRAADVERPDQLVLDLDPDPSVPWPRVIEAARRLRDRLDELGLASFVKTTGGKGLHVVAPLVPRATWPAAKAFARALAGELVRTEPARYLATASKAKRRGRIFVDYLRNDRGATAIAPYSTRARPGAPVATPLGWDELRPSLRSDRYTVANLPRRLASLRRDPWEGFDEARRPLTAALLAKLGVRSRE